METRTPIQPSNRFMPAPARLLESCLNISLLLMVLTLTVPALLHADAGGDGGEPTDPDHAEAQRLISKEAYAEAIPFLEKLLARNGQNADAYNLLGYASRKLGRFSEALAFYHTALDINPGHRGAHEYIGETYLALDQPDKALEHLKFLDEDCWLPCEEYSDLKAAVASYMARTKP